MINVPIARPLWNSREVLEGGVDACSERANRLRVNLGKM